MLETAPDDDSDPAIDVLAEARELIHPVLAGLVDRLDEPLRAIAAYQFGWRDEHGARLDAVGGKRLRPALVLAAAKASGGRADDVLPAAAAVELLHAAAVLHDDILDADVRRWHRPTAWTVFGEPQSMLAGDALLGLAFEALADLPDRQAAAVGVLGEANRRLQLGQVLDVEFQTRELVSVAECLRMSAHRTAALFAGACRLGALLGGASDPVADALTACGEHLGVAFQIVDDLLGIWGDPQDVGKPVGSDLRQQKKTLPVVAALNTDNAGTRELFELYSQDAALSDLQVRQAAELVDSTGGRALAERECTRHLTLARENLDLAGLPGDGVADLWALAEFVALRNH